VNVPIAGQPVQAGYPQPQGQIPVAQIPGQIPAGQFVPAAPAVPNQPALPQAPLQQAAVPNQPIMPNQPVVPVQQPVVPNQPTIANRPVVPGKPNSPTIGKQPSRVTTAPKQPQAKQPTPVQVTDPRQLQKAAEPKAATKRSPASQPQPSKPSSPQRAKTLASAKKPVDSPTANRPLAPNKPVPVDKSRPIPIDKAVSPVLTHADGELEDEVAQKIVRSVPSWLVSAVIHMVLLIVLGLLTRANFQEKPVEIEITEYSEELGEQLIDDSLELMTDAPDDVREEVIAFDPVEVEDPLAATVDLATVLNSLVEVDSIVAPTIGHALSGREKGAKKGLLGKYGGNATTEAAVLRGLEWLQRNQLSDGSWSLLGPYTGYSANVENKTAATAMALLAFQGAGHTHKEGEFRQTVAKGLAALLKLQSRDGDFQAGADPRQSLYAHAQATIVLCELYGMTKDEKYRESAQRAIDFCVRAQSREGGWKYSPGVDADTSVTGWFVMALQSALMAELKVPQETLDNVTSFLDSVEHQGGTRYGYMAIGYEPTLTMTAEALLCRQYLGWSRDDPRLLNGVEYINQNLIPTTEAGWEQKQNVYYWYYATQLTHHMEGEHWDRWNKVMRQQIPAHQVMKGKEKGSWDNSYDTWGVKAGRLYTTCLSIYMLEVYYRHLPIYRYRGK
jgi:hypothetical protein